MIEVDGYRRVKVTVREAEPWEQNAELYKKEILHLKQYGVDRYCCSLGAKAWELVQQGILVEGRDF